MVIEWMLVRLGQVGGVAWGQGSTTWIFFRCWHSMWMWKMPRHMVVFRLLVGRRLSSYGLDVRSGWRLGGEESKLIGVGWFD